MLRILTKCTKSADIFGKPIQLKFDKQWNTHETKIGGFSTFIFVLLVFIYTSFSINVMLNYG